MKYIRKAISLMLAVMFFAAVAVGLSVVFAVRNINVFRVDYVTSEGVAEEYEDEFDSAVARIESALSSFKGRNILGIDVDDISSVVSGSGYAEYVSLEKVYPCTLNIVVREKLEMFAVSSEDGGSYAVYDRNLSYITTKTENINNLDGSPNILLSGVEEEDFPYVAEAASVLSEIFSSVRAFAESITVSRFAAENRDTMSVKLRCGLTLDIVDYSDRIREKTEKLAAAFLLLEDYQKLDGKMTCQSSSSGNIMIVLPDGTII